jgi:hypothetical protein
MTTITIQHIAYEIENTRPCRNGRAEVLELVRRGKKGQVLKGWWLATREADGRVHGLVKVL